MLRNSSDTFINQSTARKFLDTLEDLLTSSRTAPVVRERVMDVLAAAAYASGSKKDTGFRGLWRRVKPRDKPEEGMPFDTEDAMFNPPQTGAQRTITAFDYDSNTVTVNPNAVRYDSNATPPIVTYQDATPTVPDTPPIPRPPARKRKTSETLGTGGGERDRDRDRERGERERGERGDRERRDGERGERGERERGERGERKGKRRDPKQTGFISPEEDMRRLFTECAVGVGNANLLSQALAMATPEELEDTVIMEFHKKCIDSQELIFTQIPWASAGAERSRAAKDSEERELARTRKTSANTLASINGNGSLPDLATPVSTREEELLADLLAANEQLLEALKVYDDLKRVALEREVEDRSRGEVRLDPRLRQYITEDGTLHADAMNIGGGSSSRSRSPSPARTAAATPIPMPVHGPMQHPLPSHPSQLEHGVAAYQPPLSQHPSQIQQQHVHGQPPPQTLAPPPAAPHGPRLPTAGGARTPSPAHPDLLVAAGLVGAGELANGTMRGAIAGGRSDYVYAGSNGRGSLDDSVDTHAHGYREAPYRDYNSDDDDDLDPDTRTHQPSAKALGKRKVEVDPYDLGQPLDDESSLGHKDHFDDRPLDSDDENDHTTPERFWTHQLPAPHFVYDAAAERTQARIRQGHVSALIVNGVH
ncbi:hypothetical protein K438DRAFT_1886092 [Mycena galopus ATCC 62051]|nr:hypothetical protein K438DRAFT_1886092 [Mycena galopus ATCC 62051]